MSDAETDSKPVDTRVFLVVVDNSEEMHKALRFASLRARHTNGRVALLYVQEPTEFSHWLGVDELMREEAREEGEALLQELSEEVERLSGNMPVVYIREGDGGEELFALLEEEPSISIVVLAASSKGGESSDPIISHLIGKGRGKMRTPFTIVPSTLSDEEIDGLS